MSRFFLSFVIGMSTTLGITSAIHSVSEFEASGGGAGWGFVSALSFAAAYFVATDKGKS